MCQKVRRIGLVAFFVVSTVNVVYQLLVRQDIVLFIVNAMVSGIAFYAWVNRDHPEQLKKMNRGGTVILIWMVVTIAFIFIMNHYFGYE